MTSTLRRAGAIALVGSLALAAPVLGSATLVPFAVVALVAVFLVEGGPAVVGGRLPSDARDSMHRIAALADRHERTFTRLAGVSLTAAGLSLLLASGSLPVAAFVASVVVVTYGTLGAQVALVWRRTPIVGTVGFVLVGAAAGVGSLLVASALGTPVPTLPVIVFVATSAAVLAGLVRSVLFARDEPLLLVPVALLCWLFLELPLSISATGIALALALTVALGGLAYALDAASITGMLAGVLLALLTVVLGGVGWFVVLIAFFGVGALASKFRYDRKTERGVAEPDGGARGSGNVLANAAVALAAVLAYAASPLLPVAAWVFPYVFAGSLAAAMADTLSSELGGLFDTPRLITTLEPVSPGTDGGVTWQGALAGVLGAGLIAGITVALFEDISLAGGLAVLVAGVAGMVVDSLLGATVENRRVGGSTSRTPRFDAAGSTDADAPNASADPDAPNAPADRARGGFLIDNRTVNFLATLAAAVICAALALGVGLVPA